MGFRFDGKTRARIERGAGGKMARFEILSVAALAAACFAGPALAEENKCLVETTATSKDDPAANKARIAACTDLLRTDLSADVRLQVLGHRAQAYFYLRSYTRSLLDIEQTLTIAPDSREAMYDLGLVYGGLGYSALALPRIEEAIRGGNVSTSSLANRAFIKTMLGRYGDAIADADLAIAESNSAYLAYTARAISELQLGQMSSAVPDFNKAIASEPDEVMLYRYRGLALYGLDRYREALDDLEHADRLSKGSNGHGYEDELRAILSAPQVASPSPVGGSAPARAVGHTHNCSAYYPYLPLLLGEQGDVIVHYDLSAAGISGAAVERSSGNETLDRAAVVCVNAHWRSTAAIQDGKPVATQQRAKIVFVEDREGAPLSLRAAVMVQLGRYDEAIATYAQSLARNPNDADVHFRLGFLQYIRADYAAAMSEFDKALSLKPDFDEAKAGRELVQAAMLARKPRQDI